MVPLEGLEPPRPLGPADLKSAAAANYATGALIIGYTKNFASFERKKVSINLYVKIDQIQYL